MNNRHKIKLWQDTLSIYGDMYRVSQHQQHLRGPAKARIEIFRLALRLSYLTEHSNAFDTRSYYEESRRIDRNFRFICRDLPQAPIEQIVASIPDILESSRNKLAKSRELRQLAKIPSNTLHTEISTLIELSRSANPERINEIKNIKGRIASLESQLAILHEQRLAVSFLGPKLAALYISTT